ncbi:MAG: aminotransferase class I/II-fold pyridoxal phosphate-dependent enzyme, partial [Candidatus Thorarchaeota archaeon]
MKLDITPRAANLKYAIRDIVVIARQYQKRTGEKPLYLNIGDPIAYDWKTPDFMVEAICQAARDGWNGYSPSEGEPELRKAAAEKEKRVNGIDIDPERIIVTAGVSEGIQFLTGALINPGSELL